MDFANPWAFFCRLASEYKSSKRKMLAKRSLCKHFLSLFALCRGLWLGPAGFALKVFRLVSAAALRALPAAGRVVFAAAGLSGGGLFAAAGFAVRHRAVIAVRADKAFRPIADEILASGLFERLDDELFLVGAEPLEQRAAIPCRAASSRRRQVSYRAGRCRCSTCRSRAYRAWGRSPAPARACDPWSAEIPRAARRPRVCSRGGTT